MDRPELHRLFIAKADGTITPEDHERLCILLKESAATREEWFAFQDAEAGLQAWSQREAQRRGATNLQMMVKGSSKANRWRGLRYAGAVAAGIVIGAVAWAMWPERAGHGFTGSPNGVGRDEATTSSVAVLSRGVNMEWDQSLGAPESQARPLAPGLLAVAEEQGWRRLNSSRERGSVSWKGAGGRSGAGLSRRGICRYRTFQCACAAAARLGLPPWAPRRETWWTWVRISVWILAETRRSCMSSRVKWNCTSRRRRCASSSVVRPRR